MKTLTDHLTQYAAYHQDSRNVATHFVGIPMIVLAPIGGRLAQRRGPMNVVVFSIFGAAICTFLYGFVPLWLLLVVSLAHACADSFTMPGNQIAVAMSSPPDQLAAGQGLLGSVGLLVAGAMGLIGGALYDHAGRHWLFPLTAMGMLVFVGLARWRANTAELQLALAK